jgi:hypothetical protein
VLAPALVGDEDDTVRRQKTNDAVDALAAQDALADGHAVASEFDPLADGVAVPPDLGDRRRGHDRRLQVAVDP